MDQVDSRLCDVARQRVEHDIGSRIRHGRARRTLRADQMLGAAGYMQDHPMELYYRDAKQLTIVEGTSQVQLGLIARGVIDHDLWWD